MESVEHLREQVRQGLIDSAKDEALRQLISEREALQQAAALAYQALLWRGPNEIGGMGEKQAEVALNALRDLRLAPLPYAHLEG